VSNSPTEFFTSAALTLRHVEPSANRAHDSCSLTPFSSASTGIMNSFHREFFALRTPAANGGWKQQQRWQNLCRSSVAATSSGSSAATPSTTTASARIEDSGYCHPSRPTTVVRRLSATPAPRSPRRAPPRVLPSRSVIRANPGFGTLQPFTQSTEPGAYACRTHCSSTTSSRSSEPRERPDDSSGGRACWRRPPDRPSAFTSASGFLGLASRASWSCSVGPQLFARLRDQR
jgi:hypothetical protein